MSNQDDLRAAKTELLSMIAHDPNVNGVGITTNGLTVNLLDASEAHRFPQWVHGCRVTYKQTDIVKAQ